MDFIVQYFQISLGVSEEQWLLEFPKKFRDWKHHLGFPIENKHARIIHSYSHEPQLNSILHCSGLY